MTPQNQHITFLVFTESLYIIYKDSVKSDVLVLVLLVYIHIFNYHLLLFFCLLK